MSAAETPLCSVPCAECDQPANIDLDAGPVYGIVPDDEGWVYFCTDAHGRAWVQKRVGRSDA